MKKIWGVFGVAAACAACCAIPMAMPLVAGLAAAGIGSAAFGWVAGAALLAATALAAAAFAWRHRRRAAANACRLADPPSAGCGCAPGTCPTPSSRTLHP